MASDLHPLAMLKCRSQSLDRVPYRAEIGHPVTTLLLFVLSARANNSNSLPGPIAGFVDRSYAPFLNGWSHESRFLDTQEKLSRILR